MDTEATYVIIRDSMYEPVATARLLHDDAPQDRVAKIEHMAVHQLLRHTGLGHLLIQALEQLVRDRGDQAVVLHAATQRAGLL